VRTDDDGCLEASLAAFAVPRLPTAVGHTARDWDDMQPFEGFTAEQPQQPLSERELGTIRELAAQMRAASWDIALTLVDAGIERRILPTLAGLGKFQRLANLPAFIGGLATAMVRPRPGRRFGTNPVLARLARDHVIEREQCGFSSREIVQEFLLLRRVLWTFIREHAALLDTTTLLRLEDLLNSIIDEVIAECTVIYFDRATQELSDRSRRDSLTGLLNHQAFHTRLDEELDRCRRYDHELQVIYFDLDDFKRVNDTYGHAMGDQALRVIADIVLESVRESDFTGRVGGDEFVIALVESDELTAHLLLDRLRAHLARRIARGEVAPHVGISAGCASFPGEGDSAHDILVLADKRQYEDKRARKALRGIAVDERAPADDVLVTNPPADAQLASPGPGEVPALEPPPPIPAAPDAQ
jgi:diguanylate cyclase (GGDEF)-like protein